MDLHVKHIGNNMSELLQTQKTLKVKFLQNVV